MNMEKADTSMENKFHLHSSSRFISASKKYRDATNSAHYITKTHPTKEEAKTQTYRSMLRGCKHFLLLVLSPQSTGTIWCPLTIPQPHRALLKQRSHKKYVGRNSVKWVGMSGGGQPVTLSIISACTKINVLA